MIVPESQETRTLRIEHLYTDIRSAMNTRRFDVAARLAVQLAGEFADDDGIRAMSYPICVSCNGYGEVPDPKQPEKKTMCTTTPEACAGNRQGRMSPEQFQAYVSSDQNVRDEQARQGLAVERVPTPDADGNVPRLPHDGMKRTTFEGSEPLAAHPLA